MNAEQRTGQKYVLISFGIDVNVQRNLFPRSFPEPAA